MAVDKEMMGMFRASIAYHQLQKKQMEARLKLIQILGLEDTLKRLKR